MHLILAQLQTAQKILGTALVCTLLATAMQVSAQDRKTESNWHQFRGPQATGVSPTADPPTVWSESKNVKWKFDIPGVGSSTPIVWGDRVYLTSAIKTDRIDESLTPPEKQARNGFFDIKSPNAFYKFVVICVDRKTGNPLWQKTAVEAVPNEGRHPDNNFASATPTTDGTNLFVSFGSQGFYSYSLEGEFNWKRELGKVKTRNNFGEGASLTVVDGLLAIVRDNETKSSITVLDSATGKTVWQKDRDEPSCWATPIVAQVGQQKQLITNGHTRVRSYDLRTGKLNWECGGQVMNVTPCPVLFEDHVICMSGYRGNVAMSIDIRSKGDVTGTEQVAWKLTDGTPYVPSPLLYQGQVYFTKSNGNILTCVNAKSGETIFDRKRLSQIRSIYSSPTAAAGKIYFAGRRGITVVLAAGKEYKELSVNQLEDRIDASPVLVGREIFLRGRDHLYCISEVAEKAKPE